MNSTQLTDLNGFDSSRIIFGKVETKKIPNDNPNAPTMNYRTIGIQIRNPDGTRGDLVLPTAQDIFSFGVSPNTEMGSTRINGYTMPLCLYNKEGPSEEELRFKNVFDEVIETCKQYVLKKRDDLEKYDLEEGDLKRLNPLYYRRVQGKIVDDVGPTLYAKLLYKKGKGGDEGKIITEFVNVDTNETIDPTTLEKKYCFVSGAVKFESIYVGTKISIQVKLTEAIVRLLDSGPKRLLRPAAKPAVTSTTSVTSALAGDDDDDDSDGGSGDDSGGESDGSLNESEDEEPAPTPPPVEKKTVKRVVKRK